MNNDFSYIGCKGWYRRGQDRAKFDQQPLEVACTTMMLKSAYAATGDAKYLMLQRKAFDWFLGDNDLNLPVYDFRTKGSADGLEAGGVNLNQGAESLLSFLPEVESCVRPFALGSVGRLRLIKSGQYLYLRPPHRWCGLLC